MDENNQSTNIDTRKVIKISRKKFIITTIIVVVVLIVILVISLISGVFSRVGGGSRYYDYDVMQQNSMPYDSGLGDVENESFDISTEMMPPNSYNYRYKEQTPTIKDTREFLKTSYNGSIKTRNVQDVTNEIKNIVKGADGRIDNFYSSEKIGGVTFVVAKSKFDAFREEIEKITHKKLFTETTSSQNLLTQKQGIEATTENIVNTLENLKNQKSALDTKHTQAVSSINKELTRIRAELVAVRAVIAVTTDPDVLISLRNQETSLVSQETSQKKLLNTENSNYKTQNQNLENSINNANNNLTNINEVDSQFTDNIETVSGHISVNWVSLWAMAKIFSPIHPTLVIIILVIAIRFYLKRKGHIPKIVLQ